MVSERGWRGDADNRDEWDCEDYGSSLREPTSNVDRTQHQWSRRLIRWAEDRFPSVFRDPGGSAGEEVLHDLAQDLAETTDARAVGEALAGAARRLTGSDGVSLVPNSGWRPLSGAATVIELRRGGGVWGWLVVNEDVSLPLIVRRRLETLGALASSAFKRLDDPARGEENAPTALVEAPEPARRTDVRDKPAEETDLGFYPSAPAVHDATFLNAVFPFALSQARRHGESLTVLCVAIDRLSGIRDLLGLDQVDRTVRHTGVKIATLIRSSDIVARLDDDRIMVLLPRAELPDGLTVARKLCRGVAENASLLSDAPGLTLSIGVASYPACASNLYELLDAADSALSDAQSQGRNGSASAPVITFESEARRASCAV